MRRLRELLRLKYEAGLSHRAIAQACAVGLGTVSEYLARATAAGVAWPLPDDLDDAALEARLFAPRWTGQKRQLVDGSKPAFLPATETSGVLLREGVGAQVGVDFGAPAARPALEHMRVM